MTTQHERAASLMKILPIVQAERAAAHLTEADVATLRDLVAAGTPANTRRALTNDLAYLEAWSRAVTGQPLAWPPTEADGLRFVAHHLFRASTKADAEAEGRGDQYGMPNAVQSALREAGFLRGRLPHSPSTVTRRLSSWRTIAGQRGYEEVLKTPALRQALSKGRKASEHEPGRHSPTAITRNVLDRMLTGEAGRGLSDADLARLPDGPNADPQLLDLRELRDRTLLLVAFASGGRRRSELGTLLIEKVVRQREDGAVAGRFWQDGEPPTMWWEGQGEPAPSDLTALLIAIGRTKTTDAQKGTRLVLTGRAASYLTEWLTRLGRKREPITDGPIFRAISRWGTVQEAAFGGSGVYDVVKARAAAAGFDPKAVSPHGLRSGYMTEALLAGVSLPEAMSYSLHASVNSARRYFDDAERARGKGAKLGG